MGSLVLDEVTLKPIEITKQMEIVIEVIGEAIEIIWGPMRSLGGTTKILWYLMRSLMINKVMRGP